MTASADEFTTAFSSEEMLQELYELKKTYQEELAKKYKPVSSGPKGLFNVDRDAENYALRDFKEDYIDDTVYFCSVYEEYYSDVLLARKAKYIDTYEFFEMCMNPEYKENWLAFEEDIPESTLIKDPYTRESHPGLYERLKESADSRVEVVNEQLSDQCIIVEVNATGEDDYRIHFLDEIDDLSIQLAMKGELSLHLVDGSDFLDEII